MKKAINIFGVALLLVFVIPAAVLAQEATSTPEVATTTPETIDTATSTPHLAIEGSVDVPASCEVIDTDGVPHTYLEAYLGICALEAALSNGLITDVQLSNAYPSIGLFVTTIDGVAADPNSQYWAVYQNGQFAEYGLTLLQISAGDTLMLRLSDFSGNNLGDQVTLDIRSLVSTTTVATSTESSGGDAAAMPEQNSGSGGGGGDSDETFDVSAALAYLAGQQQSDGSFGSLFLSDWAALALASADEGPARAALRNYFLTTAPALESVTDYERHAMALLALGVNPYDGANYIQPIVDAFDGVQVGDASLDNDDIFALFPLLHAGYDTSDSLIQKTVASILSAQTETGSWDGSVDMTAAAIQVLVLVDSLPEVSSALARAKEYLHTQQNSDGGFGNSFSTSWALQAIATFDESADDWTSGSLTPQDYLAGLQQNDGGIEPVSSSTQTRVWATEYAIPASLGETWDAILQSFPRPKAPEASGGSGNSRAGEVLGAATSTVAVATSTSATVITATSTPTLAPVAISIAPAIAKSAMPEKFVVTPSLLTAIAAPPARPAEVPRFWNRVRDILSSFFSFFTNLLY